MFRLIFSFLIFILFIPNDLSAHSGRTDANCGHKCSAESIRKGLCTGYHYHFANCPKASLEDGAAKDDVKLEESIECNAIEKEDKPHSHDAEGNHIDEEKHHSHEGVSHSHK